MKLMSGYLRRGRWALALLGLLLGSCAEREFHSNVRSKPAPVYNSDANPLPVVTQDQDVANPIGQDAEMLLGDFPAARLLEERLRFTLDTKAASTDFELKDIYRNQTDVYRQITRSIKTESFQQGHPASMVRDIFDQEVRKGMVDILVVIDNSISMQEEQRNLSDKMNELVASLGKSDWRIGVITTSAVIENGAPKCVMSLINSTEPNAADRFKTAVLAGTSGNSNEEGILQAVVGLSCPSNPWLRGGASVAVLIVSDEDNCSDGEGCIGSVAENETYLINYVENELGREIGKNAGFYGIFSPPSAPCFTSSNIGVQYQRLVDYKSNGTMNHGNICEPSYKSTLNRISDNIATLLGSQFELNMPPLSGTLKLTMQLADGSEKLLEAADYTLEAMTISFAPGKEPPAGAKLIADYLVEGVPLFDKLTLQEDAAPETLQVRVNGQILPKTAYQLSARTLQFAVTPEAKAEVSVDYRIDAPLLKNFQLAHIPVANSVKVIVNGQPSQDYALDNSGRQIVFTKPPTDGSDIAIEWIHLEGPQLGYALPMVENASQFQILDGSWSVPFTQQDGVFTIPAAVHKTGKVLSLKYQVPDAKKRIFSLAHEPSPNSLKIEAGDSNCQLGTGLQVEGRTLISNCGVHRKREFLIAYKYYDPQENFSLMGIDDPETGVWQVKVNGVISNNYRRQGSTIELNFEVEPTDIISLQYTFAEKKMSSNR